MAPREQLAQLVCVGTPGTRARADSIRLSAPNWSPCSQASSAQPARDRTDHLELRVPSAARRPSSRTDSASASRGGS